jgi:hypothetical protein
VFWALDDASLICYQPGAPPPCAWFAGFSGGQALRAYFVDGRSYGEAGARFGYTRWAMINLVREHRAGKLGLFAPPRKPGPAPGTAPTKDRVRGRVIELRPQGLSTYEISRRLTAEDTPLNRTSVAEILAEEGFGRLLRRPDHSRGVVAAVPASAQAHPHPAGLPRR